MPQHRSFVAAIVIFIFAILVHPCQAQPFEYYLVDLGDVPNGHGLLELVDINNRGQVAGIAAVDFDHPVRWDPVTGMRDLGTLPGYPAGRAGGINLQGDVVGGLSDQIPGSNVNVPFLWTEVGGMQRLSGTPTVGQTVANDINDLGQIVGNRQFSSFRLAFIWDSTGGYRNFFTFGESTANGINNGGQVVGQLFQDGITHAYLWSESAGKVDLGDLPGGDNSSAAFEINDRGWVTGGSGVPGGLHAFRWTPGGGLQDLGELPGGSVYAYGLDINNPGNVVGVTIGELGTRAFIWDELNGMRDLNDLADTMGWSLRSAEAINDLGQIVVDAERPGRRRGFLLQPIPEPSAIVIISIGLFLLFLLGLTRLTKHA